MTHGGNAGGGQNLAGKLLKGPAVRARRDMPMAVRVKTNATYQTSTEPVDGAGALSDKPASFLVLLVRLFLNYELLGLVFLDNFLHLL